MNLLYITKQNECTLIYFLLQIIDSLLLGEETARATSGTVCLLSRYPSEMPIIVQKKCSKEAIESIVINSKFFSGMESMTMYRIHYCPLAIVTELAQLVKVYFFLLSLQTKRASEKHINVYLRQDTAISAI